MVYGSEDADDANDEEVVEPSKLDTSLIVRVELPSFSIDEQISFHIKPSCHEKVIDGVEDIVHAIASDLQSELISVDKDGTQRKMDHLRKRALDDVKDWQGKFKEVDEWKLKVRRANQKMNTMRDAYFKELFHLREQVYQQKKCDKEGVDFNPSYAMHFDPSDYHTDEQVIALVNDKVSLIQQEYATKFSELDQKYGSKIKFLNDQVSTSKLLLTRKDKQLRKAKDEMKKLTNGQDGQEDNARRNSQGAEASAVQEALEMQAEADKMAEAKVEEEGVEAERFYKFLERKFGSLKEARIKIGLKQKLTTSVGLDEFRDLVSELGYVCQMKKVFDDLVGGAPSAPLRDFLERPSERTAMAVTRRMSADGVGPGLKELPSSSKEEKGNARATLARRHSMGAMPNIDFGDSLAFSKTKTMCTAELKPPDVPKNVDCLSEVSDGDLDFESSFEGESGSDCDNMTISGRSMRSKVSKRTASMKGGRRGSQASIMTNKTVQKAASLFSRMGKQKTKHVSGNNQGEADMLASRQVSVETVDMGTDALPYHAAFPKVKLRSCGVQSQIDSRMLDKAMDFYDTLAEDNWNELAGIMADSDSEPEEAETPPVEPQQGEGGGADAAAGIAGVLASSDTGGSGEGPGATPGESADEKTNKRPEGGRRWSGSEKVPALQGISAKSRGRRWSFCGDPEDAARVCTFADFGALDRGIGVDKLRKEFEVRGIRSIPSREPRNVRKLTAGNASIAAVQASPEMAEEEIQCEMVKVVMASPLEKWFPGDADPVEIQIQQVIDMANEIEERIPELKERADRLAGQLVRGSGERERKLLEQLNRLRFAPVAAKANALGEGAPVRHDGPKVSSGARAAPSIEELLNRHGIDAEVQDFDSDMMGRHTYHGGEQQKKRTPPTAPSAGMPRRGSGQFRMSRPPPVRVQQNVIGNGNAHEKLGESFFRSESTSPTCKSESTTSPVSGRRGSASKTVTPMTPSEPLEGSPRPGASRPLTAGAPTTSSAGLLVTSTAGDRSQITPSPNPTPGDRCLASPSPNLHTASTASTAPCARKDVHGSLSEPVADKDSDFGSDDSDKDTKASLSMKRPAQTAAMRRQQTREMDPVERARRKSNERIVVAQIPEAGKGDGSAPESAQLQDGWSGLISKEEPSFTSRGVPAEYASEGATGDSPSKTPRAETPTNADKSPRRNSASMMNMNPDSVGLSDTGFDDFGSERFTFGDQRLTQDSRMTYDSARMTDNRFTDNRLTDNRVTDNGRTSMLSMERTSRVTFSDVGSPRDTGPITGNIKRIPNRNLSKKFSGHQNDRTTDTSRVSQNSNRPTASSVCPDDAAYDRCVYNDDDNFGCGLEDTLLEEFTAERKEPMSSVKGKLGWSTNTTVPTLAGGLKGISSTSPGPDHASDVRKLPNIPSAQAASSSSSSARGAGPKMCQTMSLSEDVGASLLVRQGDGIVEFGANKYAETAGTSTSEPSEHAPRRGSTDAGQAKPLRLSKAKAEAGKKPEHPGEHKRGSAGRVAARHGTNDSRHGGTSESGGERVTAPATTSASSRSPRKELKEDEALSRQTFNALSTEEELLKDLPSASMFASNKSQKSEDGGAFHSEGAALGAPAKVLSTKTSATQPGKGLALIGHGGPAGGTQASAKTPGPVSPKTPASAKSARRPKS